MHEAWGKQVLHCAYCHGYEVRSKPIGQLAKTDYMYDMLEANLSISNNITLLFDGENVPGETLARLAVHDIRSRTEFIDKVEEVDGMLEVTFEGGQTQRLAALFVKPERAGHSQLAQQVGCELTQTGEIVTDSWGRASVRNVYAAGDIANAYAQLSSAIASGLHAAVAINIDLNATRLKRR